MEFHIIESGLFKLDGGAMFGVVPKQMWNKLNPADDNNMCTWSMRCLLLIDGDSRILFDVGLGNKQDAKFQSHFEPHGPHSLSKSLDDVGLTPDDITDVFITHLHFDHVGGALNLDQENQIIPAFPKATYWSNEKHFNWAYNPNPREKASFLKENFVPLRDMEILQFIPVEPGIQWKDNITVDFYNGHTEAMMVPTIHTPNGSRLVYCADLLPSAYHVKMPYVMSYDIDPIATMTEKKAFYDQVLSHEETYLFFEHDPINILGRLTQNDRGRYGIDVIEAAKLQSL